MTRHVAMRNDALRRLPTATPSQSRSRWHNRLALELICLAVGRRAHLVSVVVRGSTVYDAPALFAVYREQLGKPITTDRSARDRRRARREIRGRRLLAPANQLDDALLEVGVLRIDVLEPRITDVRMSGDPGPHLARLEQLGSQLQRRGPSRQAGVGTRCARCARCRG